MKLYHYDFETKKYISSSDAISGDIYPEGFLIPAQSTKIPPPEKQGYKTPVFDENTKQWNLIDDFRDMTYYLADGEEVKIEQLGVIPPENVSLTKPSFSSLNVQAINQSINQSSSLLKKVKNYFIRK